MRTGGSADWIRKSVVIGPVSAPSVATPPVCDESTLQTVALELPETPGSGPGVPMRRPGGDLRALVLSGQTCNQASPPSTTPIPLSR